jgi:hypothetical protein
MRLYLNIQEAYTKLIPKGKAEYFQILHPILEGYLFQQPKI